MCAKGNPLLGQLRGKAGDLVFSRLKGQQIVKARNRQPNNPRTNAQMRNRAKFVGAVQFFSRALQAQFKFAFESKKQKESDYNAFMRYNASKGMYLMPSEIYDRAFSCVGPFMMTKGSIAQPVIGWTSPNSDANEVLKLSLGSANPSTVAELAAQLISAYNLQAGDILTMWVAQGNEFWNGEEWETGSTPIEWKIAQLILDPNDTRTITEATADQDAHIFVGKQEGEETYGLAVADTSYTEYADDTIVCIGGACITRVVDGVVKASTSFVEMNKAAERWYNDHTTPAYIQEVLAAWNATGTPILKGGVAESNFPS